MIISESKIRKKILHVLPEPSVGGMELVAIKLASFISEVDHYFCFLYQKNDDFEILNILADKGFKSYVLGKKDGLDFSVVKKIYSLCRKEGIDIIHCRNFSTTLYGSLSRVFNKKIKLITDIRGVEFAARRTMAFKLLSKVHLIDRLIGVSEDIKNAMLKSGINKQVVDFIPNGVDLNLFRGERSKIEDRHKYGLSPAKIIIGSVGRLEKIKNFPLLVRSFAKLTSKFHNIHLVIVGDGSQRSELEKMSNEYNVENSITFLGYQNDIPTIMNLFDVFVSSSLSEGMSNVIMEAMASRLAVVATNVGGTPELIKHRQTGLLFKPDYEMELISFLEEVVMDSDLRGQLGQNAFEKIGSHYSLEVTAKKYLELYNCC